MAASAVRPRYRVVCIVVSRLIHMKELGQLLLGNGVDPREGVKPGILLFHNLAPGLKRVKLGILAAGYAPAKLLGADRSRVTRASIRVCCASACLCLPLFLKP